MVALGGCRGGGDATAIPTVVLVTLDTTRADAPGFGGGPARLTPRLDALAAESVVYAHARTVAPLTMPAHASMLTGLYPPRHGVRDNDLVALPEAARTVAERAAEVGYGTAAFVSSVALDRAFGFAQGFARYDQPGGSGRPERPAAETVAAAVRWLEAHAGDPRLFLWVHLFDPHAPYAPPAAGLARAGGDPYLGEIAAVDDALGTLLDALDARRGLDRTLVLVVADHGEARGEGGESTHSLTIYGGTIRVPMLLRPPGARGGGRRCETAVSVVDVHPTLVEALGLRPAGDLDGIGLLHRDPPADRGVYFESYAGWFNYGWSPLAGWGDAERAVLLGPAPRLETSQGVAPAGRAGMSAVEEARRAVAAVAAAPALPVPTGELPEDLRAELRGLGYTAAGGAEGEVPHPLAAEGLPDPLERVAEHERTMDAVGRVTAGDDAAALPLLRACLASNPRNLVALEALAAATLRLDRPEEAAEALRRLLALAPDRPSTYTNLAAAEEALGHMDAAIDVLRAALARDPAHRSARVQLVRLLDLLGRTDEARREAAPLSEGMDAR